MRKLVITLGLVFIVFALNAQVVKSLTNIAGTLSSVLTAKEKNTVTNLTMRGTIDARDFKTMRDSMPVLSVIDISTAKIVEYSGTKGTASNRSTSYNENTIPGNAFFNFSNQGKQTLAEIKLPSGITAIAYNAFRDCQSLKFFPLPSSLESIGTRAFSQCDFYGELTIPESVISIGESAFERCGINKLVFSASINELPKNTFKECESLRHVIINQPLIISQSLTSIGDSSFFNCSELERIYFPSTLKTIGIRAFYNCDIGYVELYDGLESIGEEAFYSCPLSEQIIIPSSVTYIGKSALRKSRTRDYYVLGENKFYASSEGVLYNKDFSELFYFHHNEVEEYQIPSIVEIISPYAFEECYYIDKLYIPESVDSIGEGAFFAIGAEIIILEDSIPIEIDDYEIFDEYNESILHVPFGSGNLYKETEPWKNHTIEEGKILKIQDQNVFLSDDYNSSADVSVICNNYWTAVSDQSWLKVTPSNTLFGNLVIKITADQNIGEERNANVIVMSPEKIDTIVVTQEKFSGILFSDTIVNIGANDNLNASIEVISSGVWIASPGESWLSVTPATPVNGNGTLNIQVQANSGSERTATITVISDGELSYITVNQEAGTNSVSDLINEDKLIIFPNPSEYFIQLNNLSGKGNISIFNAGGMKIKSINIEQMKIKSINIEQMNLIDISDFKRGIYFICFENKWGKFLKE